MSIGVSSFYYFQSVFFNPSHEKLTFTLLSLFIFMLSVGARMIKAYYLRKEISLSVFTKIEGAYILLLGGVLFTVKGLPITG